jgi:hypothetical protein
LRSLPLSPVQLCRLLREPLSLTPKFYNLP